MAETDGHGDMRSFYLEKPRDLSKPGYWGRAEYAGKSGCSGTPIRGILVSGVVAAIAFLGACIPGSLLAGVGESAATSDSAESRVIAGEASAAAPPIFVQELRSADRALMEAIAASDRQAAEPLLDPAFTWIDRDGRQRNKSELAGRTILLAAGADTNVSMQPYGRVAIITGTHRLTPDNVPAFFARVWVRQAAGWRLLLYHETAPAQATVKEAGYESRALPADCDNPCRSLPYKPLSADAQEIVASFMAGEEAAFDGNVEAANRILGDEVLFVSPTDAQPMTKTQRMAALRASRQAGQRNPPVVASMALWVFGSAGVMSADEESASGEMLRTTRIWAKRAGRWQLTFSQQTLVQ